MCWHLCSFCNKDICRYDFIISILDSLEYCPLYPGHSGGGLAGAWEEFLFMMDVKNETNSSKLNNIDDFIDEIEQQEGIDETSDTSVCFLWGSGDAKQCLKTWFLFILWAPK